MEKDQPTPEQLITDFNNDLGTFLLKWSSNMDQLEIPSGTAMPVMITGLSHILVGMMNESADETFENFLQVLRDMRIESQKEKGVEDAEQQH